MQIHLEDSNTLVISAWNHLKNGDLLWRKNWKVTSGYSSGQQSYLDTLLVASVVNTSHS